MATNADVLSCLVFQQEGGVSDLAQSAALLSVG